MLRKLLVVAILGIAILIGSPPARAATTCAAIVNGAVSVYVGLDDGTPSPTGIAMFASFAPNCGLSLSTAAADLGYIGFDWQ